MGFVWPALFEKLVAQIFKWEVSHVRFLASLEKTSRFDNLGPD